LPTGYSGTPLARKLGLADDMRVFVVNMPASVRAEIEETAAPRFVMRASLGIEAAHLFVLRAAALKDRLRRLRSVLARDGMIWVSWPKKAAKVETDITEDVIRALALPLGFVDVKVCAVDETWSGLKLVIRKALRAR
jgi:hypothetical protein